MHLQWLIHLVKYYSSEKLRKMLLVVFLLKVHERVYFLKKMIKDESLDPRVGPPQKELCFKSTPSRLPG